MRGRRPRLSPGMLLACTALTFSLAGTSFATAMQLLPQSSVGTPQLKRNAVSSPTIRNGSVRLIDLSPKARTPGPAGATGPAGPTGPKGDQGDRGESAPSNAYARSFPGPTTIPTGPIGPTTLYTPVATLRIERPGRYVIWANAAFEPVVPDGYSVVRCELRAGAVVDTSAVWMYWQVTSFLPSQPLMSALVHDFGAPGSAELVCWGTQGGNAVRARIVGINTGPAGGS